MIRIHPALLALTGLFSVSLSTESCQLLKLSIAELLSCIQIGIEYRNLKDVITIETT